MNKTQNAASHCQSKDTTTKYRDEDEANKAKIKFKNVSENIAIFERKADRVKAETKFEGISVT